LGQGREQIKDSERRMALESTKITSGKGIHVEQDSKDAFLPDIKLNISPLKQFVVSTCCLLTMPNWPTLCEKLQTTVLFLYPVI